MWECVMEALKSYDVNLEAGEDELIIFNRNNGNKMHIYRDKHYEEDLEFISFIVGFSTQHRHYDVLEDAAEYAKEIIEDRVLPLELYRKGRPGAGGDIPKEVFENLTIEALMQMMGYNREIIYSYDEYECHSWSGKYDTGRRKVSDLPSIMSLS